MRHILLVGAGVGVVLLGPGAFAQEQLLVLNAAIEVRAPMYIRPDDPETPIICGSGRTIPLRVSVSNDTPEAIEFGSEWTTSLVVSVRVADEQPSVGLSNSGVRVNRRSRSRGPLVERSIKPHQTVVDSFDVELVDGRTFAPGRYRVDVRLSEEALPDTQLRRRPILNRVMGVEIRRPSNDLELVEQSLQLALVARQLDDVAGWRKALQRALQLHPDSIPALADLGASYVYEKDCTRGLAFINRARDLTASDGDPKLLRSDHSREELIENLDAFAKLRCGL